MLDKTIPVPINQPLYVIVALILQNFQNGYSLTGFDDSCTEFNERQFYFTKTNNLSSQINIHMANYERFTFCIHEKNSIEIDCKFCPTVSYNVLLESNTRIKEDGTFEEKQLNEFVQKFRFFEQNYKKVCDYMYQLNRYTTKDGNKKLNLNYSLNTFWRFKNIMYLFEDDFIIYDNIGKEDIRNFVDFMIKFQTDQSKIKKTSFRNIELRKNGREIDLLFGAHLIFREEKLNQFKYIKHPGIYFALHAVQDESKLKNKFLKAKLSLI